MYQVGDDNLIGEDMGAFLGLILQLSKLVTAADFNVAVNGVGCRNFIEKLTSILRKANEQGTDVHEMHPGIRRFAIELVIWIMQSDPQLHCEQHFIDCGMRSALEEARETSRRASWQENFRLFSPGGIPVLEYEESLHSVVLRAQELIPPGVHNAQ